VVPAVLPRVIATIDSDGRAQVTVDGAQRAGPPVCREELGKVLTELAEQAGPVRVEIREPNGIRYADILQPRPPEPAGDEESETFVKEPIVAGEGFVPEETVLIAVVMTTTKARSDGTACLTDLVLPPGSTSEVILFGGASGRVIQRRVPAPVLSPQCRRWWRR
jgi:hypothetical protein